MIITSEKKLNIFFNHFKNKSLICLDTEFERKNTYFANLSFISVTDGNKFFIFDLIKHPKYLDGLRKVLKRNILKILHGGSQDIEIFIKNKIPYEPFFDTQIASGFLGMDKNISYANIVKKYFKTILNKDLQNQKWLKRPVSNKTLSYLKNDVKYLKKIYHKQISELKKKKKLAFAKEEFAFYNKNIKKNNGINTKFRKSLDKYKVKGVVIPKQDDSKLMPYIYSLTKLALCKSGTVNMELALYGIPQIVGYRVSRVTAFIAKRILNFKVRFISPVNLLVKKLIVPEFVQRNFNEKKIFYKACRLLDLTSERAKIKKGYILLKKELGEEGVVERAAKEIINSII